MHDEVESLGPGNIIHAAFAVADGTATRHEANELIVEFVRQARKAKIDPRLLAHVADCFAAYLARERTISSAPDAGRADATTVPITTLDKAFGLVRLTPGQPPVDWDTHCLVATAVLRRLLNGENVDDATGNVAMERKDSGLQISSDSQVRQSWASRKRDALLLLRVSRAVDADPQSGRWTAEELERIAEIYTDVPGVVSPGETPFEGRHAPKKNSGNTSA